MTPLRPGLALALVLSSCSCGSGTATAPPPPEPPTEATSAEPAPAPPSGDLLEAARAALADCNDGRPWLTLWAGLDDAQRRELAAADDVSVALQADWELTRRLVPGEHDNTRALDREGVDRFVTFVGERTGGPPPTAWADALRSAIHYPDTGATAYMTVVQAAVDRYSRSQTVDGAEIHTVPTVEVRATPEGWIVHEIEDASHPPPVPPRGQGYRIVSRPSFVLPADAFTGELGRTSHLEALLSPAYAILVPFDLGSGGVPYVMRRYEPDGTRRWQSQVCGGGRQILGGVGSQWLTLQIRGDLVLAFGVESHAVYVDALRLDDGALAWRFNSDLWFARQYPPG